MTLAWVEGYVNPQGTTDYKVQKISGADGNSAINIGTMMYPPDMPMTFSVWWKGSAATTADVNVLGETDTGAAITTSWTRYVRTAEDPHGTSIYITPASGSGDIYMCMAQLEAGTVASDWRVAAEDTDAEVATVSASLDVLSGEVSAHATEISSLDGRMDTAEAKITPTAIVSTVRSSAEYQSDLNGISEAVLNVESSNGTVFKGNTQSTVLTASVFFRDSRITTSADLIAVFGSGAQIRWKWKKHGDNDYTVVNDSHVGNSGFTFTVSASDFNNYVTIRCELVVSTVRAAQEMTISDQTDSYAVTLTTDTYTFQGDEDGVAGTQSLTTQVVVMQGNSIIPAVLGTITAPSGFTITSNGLSPSPTLTITADSTVTQGGTITIPIIIGNNIVTINKTFSYAIAFTGADGNPGSPGAPGQNGTDGTDGADGDDASTAFLTNDNITFGANSQGVVPSTTVTCNVVAYTGTDKVTPTVNTANIGGQIANQLTVTPGQASDHEIPLTIAVTNNVTLNDQTRGAITIPITAPVETTLTIYWTKISSGRGLVSTVVEYAEGASPTTAPSSGWQATVPSVAAGNYLWTRTTSAYTDGTGTVAYSVSKQGQDGTSVNILGTYATVEDLRQAHPTGSPGDAYIVGLDLYVWSANDSDWINAGQIKGEDGTPITITSTAISYATSSSGTSAPSSGWQPTIPSVDPGDYLWTKTDVVFSDNTSITSYSVSRNGTNGDDGYSTAAVYLYKRSSSAAAIDWTETLTYTFATHTLSSIPSGWSASIPSGTDDLYVTAATANSQSATDTIAYTEWAAPILFSTIGEDGLNSATVILYKRSASTPAIPTGAIRYTFADGSLTELATDALNGWTKAAPTGTNPVYMIQATAISTGTYDDIAASEWSNPTLFVQNGTDGLAGSISSSNGYLFKNAAVNTTLTLHVFKAGEEIAPTTLGTVYWYRNSESVAVGTGASYTISNGSGSTMYTAKVMSGNNTVIQASASVSSIRDIDLVTWYYTLGSPAIGDWQTDRCIENATVGDTVDFDPDTNTGYELQVVQVAQNDSFTLTGTGGTAYRLYCWTNASGVIQSAAAAGAVMTEQTVTAPGDGYLIVNAVKSASHSLTQVYPAKPTTNPPPSGWMTQEPDYTPGSNKSVYIAELTEYTDGTWEYSDVSLSSSYEAAKKAYQLAQKADTSVTNAWTQINQNTLAITQKASQTSVDALDGRIAVAESVIEQTGTGVDIVVSGTNTFRGVTSQDETTVEITDSSFIVNTDTVELTGSNNQSLHIDGNGASMDTLTVNTSLIAPNVAQKYTGSTSITVGNGGMYNSLQAALDGINGRYISSVITITLVSNIYETIRIEGVFGPGQVYIDGADYTLQGRVVIDGCTAYIYIQHLNISYSGNGGNYAVYIEISKAVTLYNMKIMGPDTTLTYYTLIYVGNYSTAHIRDVRLDAAHTLVFTGRCADVDFKDVTGTGTNFLQSYGSRITWEGKRPVGQWAESSPTLSKPVDLTTLTPDAGSGGGGGDTPVVYGEATFTAVVTRSKGNDWDNGTNLIQGYVGRTQYKGCAWFNMSSLKNMYVLNATLKIKRKSGIGRSGAISPHLWLCDVARDGNGDPTTIAESEMDCHVIGTMTPGETAVFAGPDIKWAAQKLAQHSNGNTEGDDWGIMFYTGETTTYNGSYSSNYARFDGTEGDTVEFTISYTSESPD